MQRRTFTDLVIEFLLRDTDVPGAVQHWLSQPAPSEWMREKAYGGCLKVDFMKLFKFNECLEPDDKDTRLELMEALLQQAIVVVDWHRVARELIREFRTSIKLSQIVGGDCSPRLCRAIAGYRFGVN